MARIWRIRLGVVAALLVCAAGYLLMFPNCGTPDRIQSAIVGCLRLSHACESYRRAAENTKGEYPRALSDLLNPPWGGPAYLKDVEHDLFDPWNELFMLSYDTDANGREYPLIWTVSRNGEFISQFGIGPQARSKRDAQSKK